MHENHIAIAVLIFATIVVPIIICEIRTTKRINAVIRKFHH